MLSDGNKIKKRTQSWYVIRAACSHLPYLKVIFKRKRSLGIETNCFHLAQNTEQMPVCDPMQTHPMLVQKYIKFMYNQCLKTHVACALQGVTPGTAPKNAHKNSRKKKLKKLKRLKIFSARDVLRYGTVYNNFIFIRRKLNSLISDTHV